MIQTITAQNAGGFTNFVNTGDKVTLSQTLGVIAIFTIPNKVVSPTDGTVVNIYLHADTAGVVKVGDALYDIDNGIAIAPA